MAEWKETISEILHEPPYRVEQIFLIHRETSLLLYHFAADSVAAQNAGMIAGMLTVIHDYLRETFWAEDQQDDEGPISKTGEFWIWLEKGPLAVLSVVVRGTAPEDFRLRLRNSLNIIHLQYAEPLASFKGDARSFENARTVFESCLGDFAH